MTLKTVLVVIRLVVKNIDTYNLVCCGMSANPSVWCFTFTEAWSYCGDTRLQDAGDINSHMTKYPTDISLYLYIYAAVAGAPRSRQDLKWPSACKEPNTMSIVHSGYFFFLFHSHCYKSIYDQMLLFCTMLIRFI